MHHLRSHSHSSHSSQSHSLTFFTFKNFNDFYVAFIIVNRVRLSYVEIKNYLLTFIISACWYGEVSNAGEWTK